MAIALNYDVAGTPPAIETAINIAMTTLPHPFFCDDRNVFGIDHVYAALLEAGRVTIVGLFWLAALPIAATFSLAAILYDRLLFFRSTAFRLPYLRSYSATKPLVLRRKGFETRTVGTSDRMNIGGASQFE
jgi:hypothetical protein